MYSQSSEGPLSSILYSLQDILDEGAFTYKYQFTLHLHYLMTQTHKYAKKREK